MAAAAGVRPRRAHEDRDGQGACAFGVRHGKTIGSPIAIEIINRDWKNWEEKLPVEAGDPAKHQAVASPRPGHADLAGALKYNFPDARYVLERASARESTARVAAGAFAKLMLRAWASRSGAMSSGWAAWNLERAAGWDEIDALCRDSDEVVLSLRRSRNGSAMKDEVEEVSAHRRHGQRCFRSGGARGSRRPWHLRELG